MNDVQKLIAGAAGFGIVLGVAYLTKDRTPAVLDIIDAGLSASFDASPVEEHQQVTLNITVVNKSMRDRVAIDATLIVRTECTIRQDIVMPLATSADYIVADGSKSYQYSITVPAERDSNLIAVVTVSDVTDTILAEKTLIVAIVAPIVYSASISIG
jgi:hypothetical protein